MRSVRIISVLAPAALVLASCGGASDSSDAVIPGADEARAACLEVAPVEGRALRVATTVAPITSLVALITGDTGTEVQGIVPEGTNSHTFEPPPSAAALLEDADIVFMNGLGLEEPTRELAESNAADAVLCEIGTAILPLEEWIFDFSFPEEGGKPNPHLWTNPPMVRDYMSLVLDVLVAADPANADEYRANHDALAIDVDALDAAMATATATVPAPQRKLLTYHDAYAYFAVHYGWDVIGAIQPQSFEEPSPADIAVLIEQVKKEAVPAVFGSEVFPSPVLEQIGREAGVRYVDVLRDDDLPGAPGDPDHSWWGLMRFNYVTMVTALGGDPAVLESLVATVSTPDRANYPQ